MPVTYRIDEEKGIILVWGTGLLTHDELLASTKQIIKDPALRPGMPSLIDNRQAELSDVTQETYKAAINLWDKESRRGRAKTAVVVSDELAFGMTRMLGILGETRGSKISWQVFRDADEAMRWLTETAGSAPQDD